jgi:hypothetical protein
VACHKNNAQENVMQKGHDRNMQTNISICYFFYVSIAACTQHNVVDVSKHTEIFIISTAESTEP